VDVLSGAVPSETFKDKIVLVGGTALGIGDLRSNALSKAGCRLHGRRGPRQTSSTTSSIATRKGRSFLTRGLYEEMIDTGVIPAVWIWSLDSGSAASSRSTQPSPCF